MSDAAARDPKSPSSSSDSSSSSSSSDEESRKAAKKRRKKKKKKEKKKQKKKEKKKKRRRKEEAKKNKKKQKLKQEEEEEEDDEEWKGIVFKNSRKKLPTREELIMAKVAEAQAYIERCGGGEETGSGALRGYGGRDCYGSATSFRDNNLKKKQRKLKGALQKFLKSQKKAAERDKVETDRMAILLETCGYTDKARAAAAKGERPKVRKRLPADDL